MPRTEGVSSSSRVRRCLFRPRPISVSFWPGFWPNDEPRLRHANLRHWQAPPAAGGAPARRRCAAVAAGEQFGHLLAAPRRHRARRGALLQRGERRLDHVVRVAAAERLGHHVADAQRLEHRAQRTAGDDAGAGRRAVRRITVAGAETPFHVVVQGAAFLHRHADHAALGAFGRLADRLRHLARLAGALADAALLIAHHHQRGEREAPAALHHLGHAVDGDQLVDDARRRRRGRARAPGRRPPSLGSRAILLCP